MSCRCHFNVCHSTDTLALSGQIIKFYWQNSGNSYPKSTCFIGKATEKVSDSEWIRKFKVMWRMLITSEVESDELLLSGITYYDCFLTFHSKTFSFFPRLEMSQNGCLTWMSFANRFWCEQETRVVFHFVTVVRVVSVWVTISFCFGHFWNLFFFFFSLRTSEDFF